MRCKLVIMISGLISVLCNRKGYKDAGFSCWKQRPRSQLGGGESGSSQGRKLLLQEGTKEATHSRPLPEEVQVQGASRLQGRRCTQSTMGGPRGGDNNGSGGDGYTAASALEEGLEDPPDLALCAAAADDLFQLVPQVGVRRRPPSGQRTRHRAGQPRGLEAEAGLAMGSQTSSEGGSRSSGIEHTTQRRTCWTRKDVTLFATQHHTSQVFSQSTRLQHSSI